MSSITAYRPAVAVAATKRYRYDYRIRRLVALIIMSRVLAGRIVMSLMSSPYRQCAHNNKPRMR